MSDIVCLGEPIVDMVSSQPGISLIEATAFEKAAGGAPINVAAACALLGADTSVITKVGADSLGEYMVMTLDACGVDTSRILRDPDHATQIAFVGVDARGVPSFEFHVKRPAHEQLRPDELDLAAIAAAEIFHFGAITLGPEPVRSATLAAVQAAVQGGTLVSLDPNYRPTLWPNADTAVSVALAAVEQSDVLKVSELELQMLAGTDDLQRGCANLYAMGPTLVVVTLGPEGCFFCHDSGSGHVAGFEVPVEETTGCGDAFVAATLVGILDSEHDVSALEFEQVVDILTFANATAALTATGKGAIPSLPGVEEVLELLERTGRGTVSS